MALINTPESGVLCGVCGDVTKVLSLAQVSYLHSWTAMMSALSSEYDILETYIAQALTGDTLPIVFFFVWRLKLQQEMDQCGEKSWLSVCARMCVRACVCVLTCKSSLWDSSPSRRCQMELDLGSDGSWGRRRGQSSETLPLCVHSHAAFVLSTFPVLTCPPFNTTHPSTPASP